MVLDLVLWSPWAFVRAFAIEHSTVMTILTSALIFYGGYLDFRKGRAISGKAWCMWGILILAFYAFTVLFYDQWWTLALVLLALVAETILFMRLYLDAAG